MVNPLLSSHYLPAFTKIKPEHIEPAILTLIEQCKDTVDRVVTEHATNPTWDNVLAPIEESLTKLQDAWGVVSHLKSVVNTEELRVAHDDMLPVISEFFTWLGQHDGLYASYKAIASSDCFALLSPAQQKAIKDELIGFKLSGIALPTEQREIYSQILQKESELSSKFSNNVLDATDAFIKHITDEKQLQGLPESALALARQEAKMRNLEGYVFTLKLPSYLPVMKYADDANLRYEMYYAYVTRASELGPNAGKFDNTEIIEQEMALAIEAAHLLGYQTPADVSLVTKMAENPQQVIEFLNNLVQYSQEQAKAEVAEVYAFAKTLGVEKVQPWDLTYYSEKLRQDKFAINDEQIKPYFPLPKVINGLFKLIGILYGMEVRPHLGVDVWHPDVTFYDVFDREGKQRGSFYMDLYARERKNGGAWMDSCRGRRFRSDGSLQLPIAYLICNFTPPIDGKPSLLTHDDVETIFHEFGHTLHHILTTVDVSQVAGINNVPWDAVELPSQFMENFTWQPEVLAFISGHVDTNEPLPQDLLDKLLQAKNYHSALAMLRQLEFALFDFRLHYEIDKNWSAQEMLDDVRAKVSVLEPVDFNRFQDSFTHIFAGGYSAGYYSYKWAEVLSADVFSRFEEEGVLNPKVGESFLKCILQNGGSKDFMQMFVEFRGRKPTVDALLRHSGIKK